MTGPVPTWRIDAEEENQLLLQVDVTPTERIFIMVPRRIFQTEAMDALLRATVEAQRVTHGIVSTPGEGG